MEEYPQNVLLIFSVFFIQILGGFSPRNKPETPILSGNSFVPVCSCFQWPVEIVDLAIEEIEEFEDEDFSLGFFLYVYQGQFPTFPT